MQNYKLEKRSRNRAEREKSIKEGTAGTKVLTERAVSIRLLQVLTFRRNLQAPS